MNSDFLLYILVLSIFNTALSPIISGMGFFDEFLVVLILAYAINRRDFILSHFFKGWETSIHNILNSLLLKIFVLKRATIKKHTIEISSMYSQFNNVLKNKPNI